MSLQESLYRLAMGALRGVSPLLSRGESKLARGLRARRTAAVELVRWGRTERDPSRPLVWLHAPSVGEGFQARAVAEELRRSGPDVQVVYTYFSPSAVSFARGMPADFRGYLPWDVPGEMGPVLEALAPDVIAFTKTEVWPVLTREADRRGVSTVLVAATLPSGAGRTSAPGRWLLSSTFKRLRWIAAIADEDARRFSLLGVPRERVVVTGDPGIDSAAERLEGARPGADHLAPFRVSAGGVAGSGESERAGEVDGSGAGGSDVAGSDTAGSGALDSETTVTGPSGSPQPTRRPTLVAGSTWPPDEEVLIPAVARVRESRSDLRLIIAPHEPTDDHVKSLVSALEENRWEVSLLSEIEEKGTAEGIDAVVVDRVGVLADLYTVGTVAYVGGGFHDHGLHSVLEPAAAGVPVLFGPRHSNARAAGELLEKGGAVEVGSVSELAGTLGEWLRDPTRRQVAGDRARAYIEKHRGAAHRTAELLEEVLVGGRGDEGVDGGPVVR